MNPTFQKEALRQQMLLRALWQDAPDAVVSGWLRGPPSAARGLRAYRDNAAALADKALAATFPTLRQLLGDAAFPGFARAFWRGHPPLVGDLGEWGAALSDFIAAEPALADEPYLADVARLEWAVHQAERAPDATPLVGLDRLGDTDPAALQLHFQPGVALLVSPHPVATLWAAHRPFAAADEDRFAPVRRAFHHGLGEAAWVWREGLVPRVRTLPPVEAVFSQALLAGHSLAHALNTVAGAPPAEDQPAFDFETWLLQTLRENTLAACHRHPSTT